MKHTNELNLIIFLLDHHYSIKDIEAFLDVRLDKNFFTTHYPKYIKLYQKISISTLCKLIYSIETLHKHIKNTLLKAFSYPTLLYLMSFVTIITFKKMIIPSLVINQKELILYVFNGIYYILSIFIVIFILFIIALFIIINNPIYFIILIERNYSFTTFIKDYYNLLFSLIFLHLYQEGIATQKLFAIIRNFESDYVKSCLAYVMSDQLESGMSITDSIKQSNLSEQYKNIFLTGIKSNQFYEIVSNYNEFYLMKMTQKMQRKGRIYITGAYLFLGVTVAIIYRILMIPISQIL